MKKYLVMMVAMALFGLPAFSTADQNFSGSWVRDNIKSDPAPNMYWLTREPNSGGAGGGGRGGGGGGSVARAPIVMTVQHDANRLSVTSPSGAVQKYALDGKPFSKLTDTGMAKAVINASTRGDTIVITTTQPWGGMPGNASLEIREVWSLSADGKVLTITAHHNTPARQNIYITIYNRK
jgi:hypothetical protein